MSRHPPATQPWNLLSRAVCYRAPGFYLVTVRTAFGVPWLSVVREGRLVLTPAGRVVRRAAQSLLGRFDELLIDRALLLPDRVVAILEFVDSEVPGWCSHSLGQVVAELKRCSRVRLAAAPSGRWWQRWAPGFASQALEAPELLEAARALCDRTMHEGGPPGGGPVGWRRREDAPTRPSPSRTPS